MNWNVQEKLKEVKNVALDRLKKKSMNVSFIYMFTMQGCVHCAEFKEKQLGEIVNGIKDRYEYKVCDITESPYYKQILFSADVHKVPTILLFSKGKVSSYTPDQFISTL